MELSNCIFFLMLCFGTYDNKIIEDKHLGLLLPKFTWFDNNNIQVIFPNGVEDTIKLRAADDIGNLIVHCLYEGVLRNDNSASVAVSGCQHDELVNIVIYTHNLQDRTMFNINNGTTEEVGKIIANKRDGRKIQRRLSKRGAFLDDLDYDEVAFDGKEIPEPPPFLSLEVKLAFEDSLLAEKKTEDAARDYIARVFTLGKQHFLHNSLGTKIRLRALGPIRRIHDKSWNPSSVDLKEAKKFKDPENIPMTFFCYNQDRDNDVGIAYIRRGCHQEKGVSIVAARDDIQKAAQSYSHETGHWLGLPHDMDLSAECEGQGIMSRIDTPGGRPSKWSQCTQAKFNKWYHHENRMFSQCLKEDGEVLQMESSCLASSYETVVTSTPKCNNLIVSGADYANCNGEYQISGEHVLWLPSRPVYQHIGLDRYIYWNGRGHGWSIGSKEDLKNGSDFHNSGLDSSEPWQASWRNGTTVQCKLGIKNLDQLILSDVSWLKSEMQKLTKQLELHHPPQTTTPALPPSPPTQPTTTTSIPPTLPPQASVCKSYIPLSDAWRHIDYVNRNKFQDHHCDRTGSASHYTNLGLGSSWYRFTGEAGTQLPTAPAPVGGGSTSTKRICGTYRAAHIASGGHPTIQEGIVSRDLCFQYDSDICAYKGTVKVAACRDMQGDYFVYQLQPTPSCYIAYCAID